MIVVLNELEGHIVKVVNFLILLLEQWVVNAIFFHVLLKELVMPLFIDLKDIRLDEILLVHRDKMFLTELINVVFELFLQCGDENIVLGLKVLK